MSNNSASGGYLLPSQTEKFPDDFSLNQFIQTVLVGISGLPGTLVRPSWQINPPKQPDISVDWLAYAIFVDTPNANAFVGMDSSGNQVSQRHQDILIKCTFYGPNAQDLANIVQDGFQVTQNLAPLTAANMGYVSTGAQLSIPDLINERWFFRIDMEVRLRREIIRTYAVLPFINAKGQLRSTSPSGYVSDFNTGYTPTWTTFDTLSFPADSLDTEALASCFDLDGNLYVGGLTSDISGQYYILVRKFDGTSWSTSDFYIPTDATYGQINSLTLDRLTGNLYSCGYFYNSNTGISTWFVRKFDGSSWTSLDNYLSDGHFNSATSCVCDSLGNLYVCGYGTNSDSSIDIWTVRKFDGTTWTTIDTVSDNSQANSICVDLDDNLFVSGVIDSTWTVTKWNGISWSVSDSFLPPEYGQTFGSAICADSLGNLYTTGYAIRATVGGYVWITRKFDGNSWSASDTFIFDPNQLINISSSICSDPTNNIFVGGYVYDSSTSVYRWFIRKFDGVSWSNSDNFGSIGDSFSQVYSLISNPIGTIYASGISAGIIDEWIVRKYS